jgi:type II secretory pathway component GspD/PulD (secretin)
MFSKTTGAESTYWDYTDTGETGFDVHSCGQDEERTFVGYFDKEADADFVTAVHGCLPDLVRRLLSAVDEAERASVALDVTVAKLASAEAKVDELRELITEYEADLQGLLG